MKTQYICLIGSFWTDESGEHHLTYGWSLDYHDTREAAIAEGFLTRGSDDFNVGVIQDGKLVSIDWMDEVVDADPQELRAAAEELGLQT